MWSVTTISQNCTWMLVILLFSCHCFIFCVMVCRFKLIWSCDSNWLCLTRCAKVLGHQRCVVQIFFFFPAVLTLKVALILLNITEAQCAQCVPQQFLCLFFSWFGGLFSPVAHSFICCSTNYQKELLCLHTSNVLFISFTILWEKKKQKSDKMFRKNAKWKNAKLYIFFHCFHCAICFLRKVFFFCGIHKPLFPEEQHSVPWLKGWKKERKKNPVISKRGRCAQTVRKGRDIKVEGGGELVGEQILQGRIKEQHKREMATKADSED